MGKVFQFIFIHNHWLKIPKQIEIVCKCFWSLFDSQCQQDMTAVSEQYYVEETGPKVHKHLCTMACCLYIIYKHDKSRYVLPFSNTWNWLILNKVMYIHSKVDHPMALIHYNVMDASPNQKHFPKMLNMPLLRHIYLYI